MPFVRISLRAGRSQEFRRLLGDCVYRAMLETMNVPSGDRFQVITEHDAEGLIYDPSYLYVHRTDGVIFIQVTLNIGRTLEVKRALFFIGFMPAWPPCLKTSWTSDPKTS